MSPQATRRQFIGASALAGFAAITSRKSTGAESNFGKEKLRAAGVGAGGKGGDDIRNVGRTELVVAVADCQRRRANQTLKAHPDAKFYFDFREMLEKEEKNIDMVTVGTPDHIHAPAAVMAMQMGKHVYVQKPLAHTVWECRKMLETAKKYKVQTIMGNQGTAKDGFRTGVEIIRSGAIGDVREVHVWTNRPIWPQGIYRPTKIDSVPDDLNWEMFLGPAPWRPYADGVYHPFNWRGWWDYGTGALGDMACHTANLPFMALKLGYPTRISVESDKQYPETAPSWSVIKYEFPAREGLPPVTLTWWDGDKTVDGNKVRNKPPKDILPELDEVPNTGSLMIGSKGKLLSQADYGDSYQLLPEANYKDYKKPDPVLPRAPDQDPYKELIAAIKGGRPAMSNFTYSAFLTEVVVLGNLAVRLGKSVDWDGPGMRCPNAPEADQLIKPYIPKGWILDELA